MESFAQAFEAIKKTGLTREQKREMKAMIQKGVVKLEALVDMEEDDDWKALLQSGVISNPMRPT